MKEWDGSEGEHLNDLLDNGDEDDGVFNPMQYRVSPIFSRTIYPQDAYHIAKAAKSGETVHCPTCTKAFVKKSYQQAFCSNKGAANCKDRYWNNTDDKRIDRARIWSKP